MATALQIITKALRKIRVIGMGESPETAQAEEGLDVLNDYLNQLVGFGGSQPFIDVAIDADYKLTSEHPAVRLLCKHDGAITITLPDGIDQQWMPPDGFRLAIVDVAGVAATYNITIARAGWKIAGAAANATMSTNSEARLYMFRADLGDWKLAANLALTDTFPLPADLEEGVSLILADRLSGRYAQTLFDSDMRLMRQAENLLLARYCKPKPIILEVGFSHMGAINGVARLPTDYGRRWRV